MHLMKFKAAALGHMGDHYAREGGCLNRKKDNIDWMRTEGNYALYVTPDEIVYGTQANDFPHEVRRRMNARIEEVRESHAAKGRKVRKDAVHMADWVATLPPDYEETEEDRERGLTGYSFFSDTLDFLARRYGSENVFAFVHLDETTPHMHIAVVPELDGRLNAKTKFDKADLKDIHPDLQRHLDGRGIAGTVHFGDGATRADVLRRVEASLKPDLFKEFRDEETAFERRVKASAEASVSSEREAAKADRDAAAADRAAATSAAEQAAEDLAAAEAWAHYYERLKAEDAEIRSEARRVWALGRSDVAAAIEERRKVSEKANKTVQARQAARPSQPSPEF